MNLFVECYSFFHALFLRLSELLGLVFDTPCVDEEKKANLQLKCTRLFNLIILPACCLIQLPAQKEKVREAEKDGVFVKDNPTSRDLHQVYFVLREVFLAFYFFSF